MKKKKSARYSLAKHKKKVWNLFSVAIRLRDSNEKGVCTCISCPRQGYYLNENIQAGHFQSRRFSSTLFDWENVNGQCQYCNIFLQGNQWDYGRKLDEKFGEGTADKLCNKRLDTFKIDRIYLEDIERECLELIAEEAKKKDLWDWETKLTKSQIKYINDYLNGVL